METRLKRKRAELQTSPSNEEAKKENVLNGSSKKAKKLSLVDQLHEKEEEEEQEDPTVKNIQLDKDEKKRMDTPLGENLSSYERERLEQIEKNKELMKSLFGDITKLKPNLEKTKKMNQQQSRPKPLRVTSTYSLRSRGGPLPIPIATTKQETQISPSKDVPNQENYTLSTVYRYICKSEKQQTKQEIDSKNNETNQLMKETKIDLETSNKLEERRSMGYTFTGITYSDPELSKIYALDFNKSYDLFACGGHGGRVAVFGTDVSNSNDSNPIQPLLSFRPHLGWISGIQFFTQNNNFIITSANDKSVIMWDITKQGEITNKPQMINSVDSIHSSGIFSMQEMGGLILTGSKDGNVVLSKVSDTGITKQHTYSSIHESVVKTVRFNSLNSNLFASSGNDCLIRISDLRSTDPFVSISGSHKYAINSLLWSPINEYYLLSSGFDLEMFLYDIRSSKQALFTLKGHCGVNVSKAKNIYHPTFCDNGHAIAISGEKSTSLTLFSTETGNIISQGVLDFHAQNIVNSSLTDNLALVHKKHISIYGPTYESTNVKSS